MSNKDEWGTPLELFNKLDAEFHFTLDPCASQKRLLKLGMGNYYEEQDGLRWDWVGERVFINPPYSGNNIEKWMEKCYKEHEWTEIIVMLIPTTKTGTKYFKKYAIDVGAEFRFITGRVNFVPLAGQNDNSNPLYSMLVIWR